jgi:hypothetical protein
MIFHSGILALLIGSSMTSAMLCYSAYQGARIIRDWDINSGSEHQLELERKTYLVSTIICYAMGFQLLSLLLFIYTADTISSLFVGAMCAAGSLNVNGFGYPTLLFKIVSCLFAGLWLIVNATDNKAPDYPLIRVKYWLLLLFTPWIITETVLQGAYFLNLQPNIITSCCGLLFSADANPIMSDFLTFPLLWFQTIFFSNAVITMALGLYVFRKSKGALLFSIASFIQFILGIGALISFVGIYIYELPTHHCPFCILHQEYYSVGYLMYGAIFLSGVTGMGTGIIYPFCAIPSLRDTVPLFQRRLALISVLSVLLFVLIIGLSMLFSNLSMAAYSESGWGDQQRHGRLFL